MRSAVFCGWCSQNGGFYFDCTWLPNFKTNCQLVSWFPLVCSPNWRNKEQEILHSGVPVFDGTMHNGVGDERLLGEGAKFGNNASHIYDGKIPSYFYLTVVEEPGKEVDKESKELREGSWKSGQKRIRNRQSMKAMLSDLIILMIYLASLQSNIIWLKWQCRNSKFYSNFSTIIISFTISCNQKDLLPLFLSLKTAISHSKIFPLVSTPPKKTPVNGDLPLELVSHRYMIGDYIVDLS